MKKVLLLPIVVLILVVLLKNDNDDGIEFITIHDIICESEILGGDDFDEYAAYLDTNIYDVKFGIKWACNMPDINSVCYTVSTTRKCDGALTYAAFNTMEEAVCELANMMNWFNIKYVPTDTCGVYRSRYN